MQRIPSPLHSESKGEDAFSKRTLGKSILMRISQRLHPLRFSCLREKVDLLDPEKLSKWMAAYAPCSKLHLISIYFQNKLANSFACKYLGKHRYRGLNFK